MLMTKAPVLKHPKLDAPFFTHSDTSKHCLGGVLFQKDEGNKDRIIGYLVVN